MKKLMFFLTGAITMISCMDRGSETQSAVKDSAALVTPPALPMNYPYTIDHPDNWDIGGAGNTLVVLSAVKAFQEGDIPGFMKYFGDSIHLQLDGLDKILPADSAAKMFTAARNGYKSTEIKMQDWESVISKDKKEEWVTTWFRQLWEDTKGKKDSADIVDDFQLNKGKIVRL